MSIFSSETTVTIPVPFDAPHTVTLQKLTGRDLERAQAAHLEDLIAGRSPRGLARVFRRVLDGAPQADAMAQHQPDPLEGYDRLSLVRGGLKAWSYDKEIVGVIADLDDEALEFFATEILKLTKPGLFLTDEEREAKKKSA